jgi:hypothetical protein
VQPSHKQSISIGFPRQVRHIRNRFG